MPATQASTIAEAHSLHSSGHLLAAAELYRMALATEPANQQALLGLSLIARQSGLPLPALRMAQAAVDANPTSALAHTTLAHAYQAIRDLDAAENHLHAALRFHPFELSALLALGELLTIKGRLGPAASLLHRALALKPNLAQAHYGLGNVLALEEKFPAALVSLQRAAALEKLEKPTQGASSAQTSAHRHFALGFVHGKLGQHAQAIHQYREAVLKLPNFASAWLNMGVSLVADGRDQLAELSYQQALAADPKLLSAHLNLGNLARSRKLFTQADAHYQRALALAPENSNVHVAFAYLHLEQGQFALAHQDLRLATACETNPTSTPLQFAGCAVPDPPDPLEAASSRFLHPAPLRGNAEICNALGILRLAEASERFEAAAIEAAIDAFRSAEAMGHKTAASNRGNALLRLGRVAEALSAHQSAVLQDPTHPGARYNLALTQLRMGDFERGWQNYEVRWLFREVHARPRRFAQPRWRGESLFTRPAANRRLLVYCEQGLGDTLQFVRFLPRAAALGAEILLEVQAPLARLLRPLVEALGGQLLAQGDPLPPFDLHCPLMSMTAISHTTLETIPAHIPYLRADAERAAERVAELALSLDQPSVGLAWAGNPSYRADKDRSTQLSTLLPLLQAFPEISFVSLQKGDAAAQIVSLPHGVSLIDGCREDADLADTAALLANLDLVITTDTVIAHLAGAMGKPLWLLLPWQSDWRWMQQLSTTPWYPHARLWRQTAPGDWEELITRVSQALAELSFPKAAVHSC